MRTSLRVVIAFGAAFGTALLSGCVVGPGGYGGYGGYGGMSGQYYGAPAYPVRPFFHPDYQDHQEFHQRGGFDGRGFRHSGRR